MATNLGYWDTWEMDATGSGGTGALVYVDLGDVKEISEFSLTAIKAPVGRNKSKTLKKDSLFTFVLSDLSAATQTALEEAEDTPLLSTFRGSLLSGSSQIVIVSQSVSFDRVSSKTAEEVDTFVVMCTGETYREADLYTIS